MSNDQTRNAKTTVVRRFFKDALIHVDNGDLLSTPAFDEAAKGLSLELKRCRDTLNMMFVVSTLVALILFAKFSGAALEAYGVKIGLATFSKPVIAGLLSVFYMTFLSKALTTNLIHSTLVVLFYEKIGDDLKPRDGGEFLMARYDAELLWTGAVRERRAGRVWPRAENAILALSLIPNWLAVGLQGVLVVAAVGSTSLNAFLQGDLVGGYIAGVGLLGLLSCIVAFLLAHYLKLDVYPAASVEN